MTDHESISPTARTQSSFASTSPTELSSGLYVVATPIGNLRDITLRALDVLKSADMILAEDTRQTQKLLSAYDIHTPLSAYHDHNAAKRIPGILDALSTGKVIAQVSDAGTPLISDPGFRLTQAVIEAGYPLIPIPGAAAPLAALVTSGLPSDRFTFVGFLPPKTAARRTALMDIKTLPTTLIFFETGPRIQTSLTDMHAVLGDRPAAIARELTKTYEETRRGTISQLIESVQSDPPRGEIVVVVGPHNGPQIWSEPDVITALKALLKTQSVKHASTEISEQSGWRKRDVYQLAITLS